jgi:hypothetical protein
METKKTWKSAGTLIGSALAVALLSGGIAWAARGSTTPTPSPSASAATPGGMKEGARLGRRALFRHLSSAVLTVEVGGQIHQIDVDRGTVKSISATAVTLEEADGRTVTVPLDANTRFVLNCKPVALSDIKSGVTATTMRDGDSPARVLRTRDPSLPDADAAGGTGL